MSKIKFIVRDIDILPISAAAVHIAFTTGAQDLQTDANGVTAAVPMVGSTFGYRTKHPDFAEDVGGGSFEVGQTGPTGSISKGQVLSMKWYESAGENVIEISIVLGKIAQPLSLGCFNKSWLALDVPLNPIHGTGTKGWDRFHASHDPRSEPQGEYLTCEVVGMGLPRLVAIWQPKSVDLRANKPINYLIYFHPFRPPRGPYPFDPDYVELGKTYLGNPRRTIAHMTSQGINAIGLVPIFPLEGVGPYVSLTMTQAYRLIREVNFFLQMRTGAQLLSQWRVRQPVGKVAACCFSRSIVALSSLLTNRGDDATKATEFFDQRLCEVYAFDPVPDEAARFMPGLVRWFRKGADGRRFRLYTEFDGWVGAYLNSEKELAGSPVTPETWDAEPGAISREWHGPGETFTFVHCSMTFVQPVVDIVRVGGPPSLDAEPALSVHGFFPGYFMGHALANSSLK